MTGVTSIHGWPLFKRLQTILPPGQLLGIRPPKMRIPAGPFVHSLCITDEEGMDRIGREFCPTHVIHAAGVCDLDVCEDRPHWAHRLNTQGARVVANLFGDSSYLLYLSTDLVFSGATPPPGGYCEASVPDPISVAGKTFAAGEAFFQSCPRACTVRLGLPLGESITGDKGAFDWIESRFRKSLPVTLFRDEWRSAIRCDCLADRLMCLLDHEACGLFHLGGPYPISLHSIGRYVIARGNYDSRLLRGILRCEEKNGPPRIGNVALNSRKINAFLNSHRLNH